jgi:hypothetical protein
LAGILPPDNEFGNQENGIAAYSPQRRLSPPSFSRRQRKDLGET